MEAFHAEESLKVVEAKGTGSGAGIGNWKICTMTHPEIVKKASD